MKDIVRSQEARGWLRAWRRSLTIAGVALTVVTGLVLSTALLVPRSAHARVDCYWNGGECRAGETCTWDPKMQIHWCQKDVALELKTLTVTGPTVDVTSTKDISCNHCEKFGAMAECAAEDIPGRSPGICARELRECRERCRTHRTPAKDLPPTAAPAPPADKDAACTVARQRTRTACANLNDELHDRDLKDLHRCAQTANEAITACATY